MKNLDKEKELKINRMEDAKPKKKYQKPHIVHTKVIETLAGSCVSTIGNNCQPVQ